MGANYISSMAVGLTASTTGLARGLDRGKGMVRGWSREIAGMKPPTLFAKVATGLGRVGDVIVKSTSGVAKFASTAASITTVGVALSGAAGWAIAARKNNQGLFKSVRDIAGQMRAVANGSKTAGQAIEGTFAGRAAKAIRSVVTEAGGLERIAKSKVGINLAGADTLHELRKTLAVARSELRTFGRNTDVGVAVEIGREKIDEAAIQAKRWLAAKKLKVQIGIEGLREEFAESWIGLKRDAIAAAKALKLNVPVDIAGNAAKSIKRNLTMPKAAPPPLPGEPKRLKLGFELNFSDFRPLDALRKQLASKPPAIAVAVGLARGAKQAVVGRVTQIVGDAKAQLQQLRGVRIAIAAVNGLKNPASAALKTLAPLRKLAANGIKIGFSIGQIGVIRGVKGVFDSLGSLFKFGKTVGGGLASALAGGLEIAGSIGSKALSGVMSIAQGVAGAFTSVIGGIASVAVGFAEAAVNVGMFVLKAGALAGVAVGIAAVGVAFASLSSGVKLAAQLEQTNVAFTTMLRDAGAAKQLMGELQTFAAKTPYEFPELATSGKSLLAFGVEARNVLPTLTRLGDVAAGVSIPITELSDLYGKMRVQGRLYQQDVNQLTGRGIPVIQQFAKQFGVAEAGVKDLVSAGKIGFPELEKAFAAMTGSGGQFAGMMLAQSTTLTGLWSTLRDTWSMAWANIAQVIIEAFDIKAGITMLTNGVASAVPVVLGFVQRTAPVIKAWATAVWTWIASVWQRVQGPLAMTWAYIKTGFAIVYNVTSKVMGALVSFARDTFTGIYSVVASKWDSTYASVSAYASAIAYAVTGLWGALSDAFVSGVSFVTGTTMTGSQAISEAFGWMIDASNWLRDQMTSVFHTLGFVFRNWQDIGALAILKVQYAVTAFANDIIHFFSVVIPGYLQWFGNNWSDVFNDMADLQSRVFENMLKNAARFAKSLWNAIKGKGFDYKFTPLTEGFKSSLKELPKIAKREIGDTEGILKQAADSLQRELAGKKFIADFDVGYWKSKFQKSVVPLYQDAQKLAGTWAKGLSDAWFGSDAVTTAATLPSPIIPPVTVKADIDPDTLKLTVTPEIKLAKLVRANSAEAYLRQFMPQQSAAGPQPKQSGILASGFHAATDLAAKAFASTSSGLSTFRDGLLATAKNTRDFKSRALVSGALSDGLSGLSPTVGAIAKRFAPDVSSGLDRSAARARLSISRQQLAATKRMPAAARLAMARAKAPPAPTAETVRARDLSTARMSPAERRQLQAQQQTNSILGRVAGVLENGPQLIDSFG